MQKILQQALYVKDMLVSTRREPDEEFDSLHIGKYIRGSVD